MKSLAIGSFVSFLGYFCSSVCFWTLSFPTLISSAPIRPSNHTSNHALILSSSRFWFNYRHAVNALSIYNLIKQNGIPDENIILMLADEFPINPRNPFKNKMYQDLMDSNVQIDYRGDDVTVENLRNALLGKTKTGTYSTNSTTRQNQRVLHTDANSNVLLYWTGHGGHSFFKFQDVEEITSMDLQRILQQMKFHSLLFLADTCQAFTLGNQLAPIPNVYMIGSSLEGENSYAHHVDADLGLSVIERYTHRFMEFLKQAQAQYGRSSNDYLSQLSLAQAMVHPFEYRHQGAHVGVMRTDGTRPLEEIPLSDFFAAIPRKKAQRHGNDKARAEMVLLDQTKINSVGRAWTQALASASLS